jgi:vancomycin permeability regulator SanA
MTDPAIARLFLRDEPRPADLALVFGYHVREGADRRARAAARLYLAGMTPRLLFTGGGPVRSGDEAEAIRMAHIAVGMAVPRQAILVERYSRNTFENAICARVLLADADLLDGLATVILVSCPWHMGRAVRIMRTTFPTTIDFVCCPQEEDCTADTWQDSEECRKRVLAEAELLDGLIRAGVLPEVVERNSFRSGSRTE